MRLSRYTIDIEVDGNTYCYNLLNGNYVYKNRLYKNSSFFVEDSCDEFIEINSYNKKLRENSNFICLTLKITQDCNFKCDYCFEQHEKIYLDMSTIEKLCHIIKSYIIHHKNINQIVVIWFGGEPLLHIKYMLAATESLKKLATEMDIHYSSRIITNGYLLESILLSIRMLSLTDIQITLDGTQKMHDSRRKSLDSEGSFDIIIDSLKKIRDKIDLVIRVNVDSANIDNIFYLYDYIRRLEINKNVTVYFQPMLVENYGGESECYLSNVLQDKTLNLKYIDLLKYTNNLKKPKFIKAFCNVDFTGSIVVSSGARLYKCWAATERDNAEFATINDPVSDIIAKMEKTNFNFKSDKCIECLIFPVCMGGCKYKPYNADDCLARKKMIINYIKACISVHL
jgi:uncharacterized protein